MVRDGHCVYQDKLTAEKETTQSSKSSVSGKGEIKVRVSNQGKCREKEKSDQEW